ncbi:unnamed protein product, partial [Meganyctiphanes norvegica]
MVQPQLTGYSRANPDPVSPDGQPIISIAVAGSKTVAKIFETMEYGPAPEDDKVAQAWLDDHGRKFGHFINNKWEHPEDRKTYETKDPCHGTVLATTVQGNEEDVHQAVTAAKEAHKSWSQLSGHVRARHLYSLARHVQKHSRLLAVVESLDNGKTIRETRDSDIPLLVRHLYYHAGWAQLMDTEMKEWKDIGVVGAIVPWNFPLMLMAWKICPALAMGNTVVLKPATVTRLSALLFAEICAEAGLPPGVFNVITGGGAMGSFLAQHPDVDKVGFTGSTEIGQLLRKNTAGTGKKLSLELGGKSPVIVYDSADLDSAVEGVVDAIWFNQGQVCSAGSRLLVQEPIFNNFINKLKRRMSTLRLGSSLDKVMDMGAMVDECQRKYVSDYVEDARKEGAEIFQIEAPTGCFYPPTLITSVGTTSKCVVEEIFGPVLVALPFRTEKEAIALANNTIYGLGASVFTERMTLGIETAKMIKAGAVWINCHNIFDAAAGFGGYKQSGYGRDGGKEGLYEYVKPQWQGRLSFKSPEIDVTKFGAAYMADRPSISPANTEIVSADGTLPKVDRTYKLYYGGAQKRPDGNYCRVINNAHGKSFALVGESNSEISHPADKHIPVRGGISRRVAGNKFSIILFATQNAEFRSTGFSQLLANLAEIHGQLHTSAADDVDATIARLFHWASYCDKYGGTVQETTLYGTVLKIHEPIGCVGVACPDEDPLLAFVALVAPLIARGNAVVAVPSQKYPTPALALYQVLETSDLPGGVLNILTGNRDHITKYLAEHQDIQSMWYFGSLEGSKFVEYTSAVNVKRTWVNYGLERDWIDDQQGAGEEFLYHSTQVKNVWLTMGEIFAN